MPTVNKCGASVPETVLQEAERLINGERHAQYGAAADLFKQWSGAVESVIGRKLKREELAIIMVLLKLIRFSNSNYRHKDSLVDAAGYIGLIGQFAKLDKE